MNPWDETLAKIEPLVSTTAFATWFAPTRYIKADTVIHVLVPTVDFVKILTLRTYGMIITSCLPEPFKRVSYEISKEGLLAYRELLLNDIYCRLITAEFSRRRGGHYKCALEATSHLVDLLVGTKVNHITVLVLLEQAERYRNLRQSQRRSIPLAERPEHL
jgi:hypothetical protein